MRNNQSSLVAEGNSMNATFNLGSVLSSVPGARRVTRCAAHWLVGLLAAYLFLVLVPSSALAKGLPGATQTSYGVSQSGAFQYQIPIVIPQGTNGVQPNLSLSFSSGGRNGSLGVGWGLAGLSSITRCGKTHATNGIKGGVLHDANDRFCLNGKQLILVKGKYGVKNSEYRTEIDEFSKIVALGTNNSNVSGGTVPTSWEVSRKDGSIHEYGTNTAQFKLPGTSSIHAWKLSRAYNRNGNYYQVTYEATEGLPTRIDYTTGTGLTADRSVRFTYATKSDKRTRYIAGKLITNQKRMTNLSVYHGGTRVRDYRLAYQNTGSSKKSRITSVTECGLNNECMPPISIAWKSETKGFTTATAAADEAPYIMHRFDTYRVTQADGSKIDKITEVNHGTWADVNGDGEVDQVIAVILPNGTQILKTYLKTATGWDDTQTQWALNKPLRNYSTAITDKAAFAPRVVNQGQLVDVNGDGLVDVVYAYAHRHGSYVQETWVNNGNGWSRNSGYDLPGYIYDYTGNSGPVVIDGNTVTQWVETIRGKLVDINGDGLVDWVSAYFHYTSGGQGNSYQDTRLNTGSGWGTAAANNYELPDVFVEYNKSNSLGHGQLVDVNGDGLLDWVQAYWKQWKTNETGSRHATWLNTGSTFEAQPSNSPYILPDIIHDNHGDWRWPAVRGSFVDVNGDGLKDWVRDYEGGVGNVYTQKTWLSTGKGWIYTPAYNAPFIHKDHSEVRHSRFTWPVNLRGYYVDVNRDGLVDFSQSYKDVDGGNHMDTWINTGNIWSQDNSYNVGLLFFDYSGQSNPKVSYGDMIDINSDGSADWLQSRENVSLTAKLNNLDKIDLVSQFTSTMGVKVKPTFATLTANDEIYTKVPTDPNTNLPIPAASDAFYLEAPICVVSELETSRPDGSGFNATEYSYAGAQVHRRGRGYLGFKSRIATNIQTGISEYREFKQGFPYTGMLSKVAVSKGSTDLSMTTSNHASRKLNNNKTWFPYVTSTLSSTDELNGDGTYTSTYNTFTYDDFGNVTRNYQKTGAAVGANQGEIWDDKIYNNITSSWLIGQVATAKVTVRVPAQATLVRDNSFSYDGRGRLSSSTREPSASAPLKLVTTYGYDTYGNIIRETITGENARVNNIAYDSQHRLPASMSNALNQSSSITYHAQCDQPATATDANGLISRYEYDNFCRQTKETLPAGLDGVVTTTAYQTTSLSCTSCQTTPKLAVTTQSTGQAAVTAYFNSHAQSMLSTTTGMFGEAIQQKTDYDSFGRVSRASQPYFVTDNVYYTSYYYDVLNRLTRTELPFFNDFGQTAAIQQAYSLDAANRRTVTTTDVKGRSRTTYANALSQIVEIQDADSNSLTYGFDSQGNLIHTVDAAGNTITVGYDLLGRRTSLDDPDMGLSSFAYNAFSEMTGQTDAKGQTISMIYDQLGRMTNRTVPGSASESGGTSVFTYDTAAKGVGAIASVSGPNGYLKTHSYDQTARPSGDVTTIKGGSYTQSYGYNANSQLATRSYPDSGAGHAFSINYNYLNGYLSSITGGDPHSADCIEHWRADKYDALGRTEQETLGKLVTTTKSYKPGQGVLEHIQSIVNVNQGGTVQDLSYTYDAANNLDTRSDDVNNINESFIYDNLDRLTQHTNGGEVVDVTYDAIGNILSKSDVGSYNYDGINAGPHALTRVDSPTPAANPLAKFAVNWEWNGETIPQTQPQIHDSQFEYDANGNIKVSGDRYVWWTAFDKPYRMERFDAATGSVTTGSTLEYDAAFNRIYKLQDDGQATVYIGKDYERISVPGETGRADVITHRYTIATGGATIQIERADGTGFDQPKYLLADNLGSTNVILDASGNVEQTLAFDPWGMRTNTGDITAVNGITNKGYTGHEMDDEVGLVNMNARIYDPYLGRFLSADPVLPDAYDMQQYNRYSYVSNNPLRYTDPTGNCAEPASFSACTVIVDAIVATALNLIFGGGGGEPGPAIIVGHNDGLDGLYGLLGPIDLSELDSEALNDFLNGVPSAAVQAVIDGYNLDNSGAGKDSENSRDDESIELDIGISLDIGHGRECTSRICFDGPGTNNPVVLAEYVGILGRYAATKEGQKLLTEYFRGTSKEVQFVIDLQLSIPRGSNANPTSGTIHIDLSAETPSSPFARVWRGENNTWVGSPFRAFAHESYHALRQDYTSAQRDLGGAVDSANRAVMQDAINRGDPSSAGVRVSYNHRDSEFRSDHSPESLRL